MDVLMVDDEEDICMLVSRILERQGVHCHCSGMMHAAIEKIRDVAYQLYIVDLSLPDGSGFELVPIIFEQQAEARVVIISAHDDMNNRERAADLGVEQFIAKPFTKDDILSLIPK